MAICISLLKQCPRVAAAATDGDREAAGVIFIMAKAERL